jgi:hypothetical protein
VGPIYLKGRSHRYPMFGVDEPSARGRTPGRALFSGVF